MKNHLLVVCSVISLGSAAFAMSQIPSSSKDVKVLNQLLPLDSSSYYLLEGSNQAEKDCSVLIRATKSGDYDMPSVDGQFGEIKKDSYMINTAVAYGRYVPSQDTILANTDNLLNIAMNPLLDVEDKFFGQVIVIRKGLDTLEDTVQKGELTFTYLSKTGELQTSCKIHSSKKLNY